MIGADEIVLMLNNSIVANTTRGNILDLDEAV